MDLTRDLSWWESDRKWMKKLRNFFLFHLKHRVIFNEDLNCNLHRRGDRLIISQTNRSERIKALSEAFHADLSDFVPKLPFQYADSISRWPREANRKGESFDESGKWRRWRGQLIFAWAGNLTTLGNLAIFGQEGDAPMWLEETDPPRNISEIDWSPISANLLAISGHRMRTGRSMKIRKSLNAETQDHDLRSPKKLFPINQKLIPSQLCLHFIGIHWTEPVVPCIGV